MREKLRHTNRISLCILVTFNPHKPCMNNLLPPPLGGSKGWGGHLWSTLVSNCCVTLGDGGSLPEPLSLYEGDGTSLHWLQVDPPQCLLSAIGSTLPVPTRVSKSLLGTALPRDGDLQLWWLPSSKQDSQWISSSENHFQVLLVSGKGCLHYSVASCAMAICYKSFQPLGMTWDSLKTDGKTDWTHRGMSSAFPM